MTGCNVDTTAVLSAVLGLVEVSQTFGRVGAVEVDCVGSVIGVGSCSVSRSTRSRVRAVDAVSVAVGAGSFGSTPLKVGAIEVISVAHVIGAIEVISVAHVIGAILWMDCGSTRWNVISIHYTRPFEEYACLV
jgi:hypothetical protein